MQYGEFIAQNRSIQHDKMYFSILLCSVLFTYKLYAGIAAIHGESDTGDVGGSIGRKEDNSAVQFALMTISLQRDDRLGILCKIVGLQSLFRQGRDEVSRADGIHRDAVFSPFGRQRPREIDNASFGSMIRRSRSNLITHQAIHRCDIDHTSVAAICTPRPPEQHKSTIIFPYLQIFGVFFRSKISQEIRKVCARLHI